MECERGVVDGLVLDVLRDTAFRHGDFLTVSDGTCRLHPQRARAVVARCGVAQERVDAQACWLAEHFPVPTSGR
jgi:hypothetical protein